MTNEGAGSVAEVESYPDVDGLLVEARDGVLTLTLNRPDELNALTSTMLIGLASVIEFAADDHRLKLVVLRGAGRSFSAGADIGGQGASSSAPMTPADVMEVVTRIIATIAKFPHPVLALVSGPAVGLGASLALACDVVLTSQSAYFQLGSTKIGLMPDGGASALIPASVGRMRAMRMTLLAERISAAEALHWGLVTAEYSDDAFIAESNRIIEQLASGPTRALQKTKEAVNAATLAELDAALELEGRGQDELLRSDDFVKSVAAFQRRTVSR